MKKKYIESFEKLIDYRILSYIQMYAHKKLFYYIYKLLIKHAHFVCPNFRILKGTNKNNFPHYLYKIFDIFQTSHQ